MPYITKIINGEEHTQETVVKAHKGLVHMECNKVRYVAASVGMDYEDLYSIGSIGLLKAFENFNPEYGVRFSTYAVPLIWGELQRSIRDSNPGLYYSRPVKELGWKI